MPPTLNADTIQDLTTRIKNAYSEVRRGYDFGNVDEFDDEQRDHATTLVQQLMNEIDDALNIYDACEIPVGRAEFAANQMLELIHKCRTYVEQHPDITTLKGDGSGMVSGISPVRENEGDEVRDLPPNSADLPPTQGGNEDVPGSCATDDEDDDGLEYDEFDATGPNYGGFMIFTMKSLSLHHPLLPLVFHLVRAVLRTEHWQRLSGTSPQLYPQVMPMGVSYLLLTRVLDLLVWWGLEKMQRVVVKSLLLSLCLSNFRDPVRVGRYRDGSRGRRLGELHPGRRQVVVHPSIPRDPCS